MDNVSSLLEESEKTGLKLAKEVDKLSSKVQDLEVGMVQQPLGSLRTTNRCNV